MRFNRHFVVVETLIALVLLPAGAAVARQSQKAPAQSNAPHASEDPVDINTTTVDQLMRVPGMTRTWAERIVRFRPYRAKNELLDRGIVSGAVYSRIKDHIIAHRPAQ